MNSKGGVTVSVVTTGPHGDKPKSSISLTDLKKSITIANDLEPDFKLVSRSDSVDSPSGESFDEPEMQDQSALPAGILPAVPPASVLVPPHLPDKANSTLPLYSFFEAV